MKMLQESVLLIVLITGLSTSTAVKHCLHDVKTNELCSCCYTGYSGDTCSICKKCVQQYTNRVCRRQCEGHTMHGEYCNITCSGNCLNGQCERENGRCQDCKDGHYGEDCSYSCSCFGGPCDRKTGICIKWEVCEHCESRRCYKDGKDGSLVCHGKCAGPYYGIDCSKHCPSLCDRCDQQTGSCLHDTIKSTDGPSKETSKGEYSVPIRIIAVSVCFIALYKLGVLRKIKMGFNWAMRKYNCRKRSESTSSTSANQSDLSPTSPLLQQPEPGTSNVLGQSSDTTNTPPSTSQKFNQHNPEDSGNSKSTLAHEPVKRPVPLSREAAMAQEEEESAEQCPRPDISLSLKTEI